MTLIRRALALHVCVLLLLAAGCREKADPVRATLERIRKAAEARDPAGVLENLTSDFRDDTGGGAGEVSEALRRYFAAYEVLNLQVRDLTIERAAEAARPLPRRLLRPAAKIGGLDELLPSASAYNFDVRLVPDGKRWKVAWAAWKVVGDR